MLYRKIAHKIKQQIDSGTLQAGDKLPGVRRLSEIYKVSISTIVMANRLLEDDGSIEARPKSGYYVCQRAWLPPDLPKTQRVKSKPFKVETHALALAVAQASTNSRMVNLGAAVPHASFLPQRSLQRIIAKLNRTRCAEGMAYSFPPGNLGLRRQLAKRMVKAGCHQIHPDDILVTNGCQEALYLALRSVTSPGDVVAIETPTFYGLLQLIESLGLRAIEIPTNAEHGIELDALALALEKWPIKTLALVSNYSNPLGCCLSDTKKAALVALMSDHGLPIIEDDIYGDLGFGNFRPKAIKALDEDGTVIYCSSFSKTISPGLRIGWMIPGKYVDKAEMLKFATNLAISAQSELVVSEFLKSGGYDRYLRNVRLEFQRHVQKLIQSISQYFPKGTRVSQPAGGFVVWVEMPKGADSMALYQMALHEGISITPGPMFSADRRYGNCIRINCAQPRNQQLESALVTLGQLVDHLISQ